MTKYGMFAKESHAGCTVFLKIVSSCDALPTGTVAVGHRPRGLVVCFPFPAPTNIYVHDHVGSQWCG